MTCVWSVDTLVLSDLVVLISEVWILSEGTLSHHHWIALVIMMTILPGHLDFISVEHRNIVLQDSCTINVLHNLFLLVSAIKVVIIGTDIILISHTQRVIIKFRHWNLKYRPCIIWVLSYHLFALLIDPYFYFSMDIFRESKSLVVLKNSLWRVISKEKLSMNLAPTLL